MKKIVVTWIVGMSSGLVLAGEMAAVSSDAGRTIQQSRKRVVNSYQMSPDSHVEGHRRMGGDYRPERRTTAKPATTKSSTTANPASQSPRIGAIPPADKVEESEYGREELEFEFERRYAMMDFFREANRTIKGGTILIVERQLMEGKRKEILERDEHCCVVCKRSHYVEVDLARAAVNGGQSNEDNLVTLCSECRARKTVLDKKLHASLRANGIAFGKL